MSDEEQVAWVDEDEGFIKANRVSDRTIIMCRRFWTGEWEGLLI